MVIRKRAPINGSGGIEAFLKSILGYDLCTAEFALHTYDAPYVQKFLVPYLQRKSETKTIIVAGPPSTQKSNFAKSLFGEYHFVTSVDALKLCSWYKCRNIIADDFDFTTLKDQSVGSLKQLFLVDVNSEDSADVNCRFSPAKVPVNVRRTFTTNCLTLEAFLKKYMSRLSTGTRSRVGSNGCSSATCMACQVFRTARISCHRWLPRPLSNSSILTPVCASPRASAG